MDTTYLIETIKCFMGYTADRQQLAGCLLRMNLRIGPLWEGGGARMKDSLPWCTVFILPRINAPRAAMSSGLSLGAALKL